MSTKSLKNVFRSDGKGRLQDLYSDFENPESIAITKLSQESGQKHESSYSELIHLLFPTSAAGFTNGKEFWKKIKELAGNPTGALDPFEAMVGSGAKKVELAKFLAELVRVYYYDGQGKSNEESEIPEFYKVWRPSAYRAFDGKNYEHISGGLRSLLTSAADEDAVAELKSSLLMVMVDTSAIDLKLRNADVVSTFLNYTPSIMASQMVPYLDVRFAFKRNSKEVNGQTSRPQTVMTPLKFLMGAQEIKTSGGGDSSATGLIYDTYTKTVVKQKLQLDLNEYQRQRKELYLARQEGKSNQQPPPPQQEPALQISKDATQTTTTGMEMFLMPQTLINMDYDQITTPRYNEVLNSTLPFGSIMGFNVNVTSAGYGVFSYKTATLKLMIFDRSRLVEIADFLNPKLYGKATLWITYGWRAPAQDSAGSSERNEYLAMINEHMLKKEAYGITNTSISIADNGTCEVTLSLCMKFAQDLSTITPTGGSAVFEAEQEFINAKLAEIRQLAETLGLGNSGAKDIRGATLIKSAMEGSIPTIDPAALAKELQYIRNALQGNNDPNAKRFLDLAGDLYSISTGGTKASALSNLETIARRVAADRFDQIRNTKEFDVWSVISADTDSKKFEKDDPKPPRHPLSKMHKLLAERKITAAANGVPTDGSAYGRFGDVSFARLFATFFSSAVRTLDRDTAEIDEYQVIFYNFNDLAGPVANVNIGEFPIDITTLEKAYSEYITKQKGENMTLLNFLEIVRQSQFGNERHKAFGLSDLFDKEGKIIENQADVYHKRMIYNEGLGSGFVPPAVDFYVETSNGTSKNVITDLLTSFEASSIISSGSEKPEDQYRIVRIHIYDKASIPHKAAYDILRDDSGSFIEADNAWKNKFMRGQKEILRNIEESTRNNANARKAKIDDYNKQQAKVTGEVGNLQAVYSVAGSDNNVEIKGRKVTFKDPQNGPARFSLVKKEISRFVPTLTVGTNGTMIRSINYSSEQDAKLATIFMLRNKNSDKEPDNPSTPNGSSTGDLPMRVVPGQLSITTAGCPLLEYMQQFFVDLGTGTTIDNLYNITGLTHNISQGSFTSEVKFTFADAYGKYEGARDAISSLSVMADRIKKEADASSQAQARAGSSPKPAKK